MVLEFTNESTEPASRPGPGDPARMTRARPRVRTDLNSCELVLRPAPDPHNGAADRYRSVVIPLWPDGWMERHACWPGIVGESRLMTVPRNILLLSQSPQPLT